MEEQRGVLLITGSSGLIGSALIDRFADQFQVIGMDIKEPDQPSPARFINLDLTSDQSVADALRQVRDAHGERIASVIHLAAFYDFSGDPSPQYERITVRGTERLIRGLQDFQVEQFIFSSTMLVHAPTRPGERVSEDSPLDPRWPYPESKVQTEELLRSQRGDIPLVLMRIAGVYDDYCHSLPIAQQIRRIYERQLVGRMFPGDLDSGQSFVHMEDAVDAFWRAVERRHDLPPESVFIIGEADPVSYGELQRTFGQLIHGKEWATVRIPVAMAKVGAWVQGAIPVGEDPFIKPKMVDFADDYYALDTTRARELLGWEPKHSLRDSVPKMVEALKEDPAGWYREHKIEPPSSLN